MGFLKKSETFVETGDRLQYGLIVRCFRLPGLWLELLLWLGLPLWGGDLSQREQAEKKEENGVEVHGIIQGGPQRLRRWRR